MNKIFWYISALYLFYLASITQTILFHDAFGYERLGQLLFQKGWLAYWASGLTREPLYPWFVSLAMHIAQGLTIDYLQVLLVGQVLIFLGMLALLDQLLVRLGIPKAGRAVINVYAILSPALIYTVFIEWSEIITYPLVLLIILVCIKAWSFIFQSSSSKRKALALGAILACCVLALTFVKAVMELMAIVIIVPWMIAALKYWKNSIQRFFVALCIVLGFLAVYGSVISAYKMINFHFNGQYVLTDRGSWALYGNTARRMAPLSSRQWMAGLLSIPSNGAECYSLMKPPQVCDYWTFTISDNLGYGAWNELQAQGKTPEDINRALIKKSLLEMAHNPLQAGLLFLMEGMKFMFWEFNARLEYAAFPSWLYHVYENRMVYVILHYGMALFSFIALADGLIHLCRNRRVLFMPQEKAFDGTIALFFVLLFVLFFIASYSFFLCSGRYAMPLAPLFLALIAAFLSRISVKQQPKM